MRPQDAQMILYTGSSGREGLEASLAQFLLGHRECVVRQEG